MTSLGELSPEFCVWLTDFSQISRRVDREAGSAQHSEELMRADRRPARTPAADDAIAGCGDIRGALMASLSMAEPIATRPEYPLGLHHFVTEFTRCHAFFTILSRKISGSFHSFSIEQRDVAFALSSASTRPMTDLRNLTHTTARNALCRGSPSWFGYVALNEPALAGGVAVGSVRFGGGSEP
jgi:hypothetical protein